MNTICVAIKKNGIRCTFKMKHGDYCGVHKSLFSSSTILSTKKIVKSLNNTLRKNNIVLKKKNEEIIQLEEKHENECYDLKHMAEMTEEILQDKIKVLKQNKKVLVDHLREISPNHEAYQKIIDYEEYSQKIDDVLKYHPKKLEAISSSDMDKLSKKFKSPIEDIVEKYLNMKADRNDKAHPGKMRKCKVCKIIKILGAFPAVVRPKKLYYERTCQNCKGVKYYLSKILKMPFNKIKSKHIKYAKDHKHVRDITHKLVK